MKFDLQTIARKSLAAIQPYSTARDDFKGEASIYLDANENPFDTPYNRYPDPKQTNLKEKIASLKNVNAGQIILGNGSDEIIDLIFRACCKPGVDNVIIPQPTYGMYDVCAAINNVLVKSPQLNIDFDLDIASINDAIDLKTKIVFLCSPNNPTGNLLSRDNIEKLLVSFNGIVVVDEAYIDFANSNSWLNSLNQYPNLMVIQTFSKAWGLAALRLGAGYGSKELIGLLMKIKPPYNINSVTQELVYNSISNVQLKDDCVRTILEERSKITTALDRLSCIKKVYPSDANFILVKVGDAKACYTYLLDKGIIVRDRSGAVNCEECLRISVGTPAENKTLIESLIEYEKSIVH